MSDDQRLGLTREPFDLAPEAAMFYRALGHQDCEERLRRAVQGPAGLAVVIGGAGYGKTMLRVAFLAALLHAAARDGGCLIGQIDDPRQCRTDVQLLRAILRQLGQVPVGRTGLDLTTELREHLAAAQTHSARPLLVIDAAHHLASSQLEILRTILSLGTSPAPMIEIVLFGQPQLEERMLRKRQLASQIGMAHRLNPLNRRDTAGLIAHRLAVASDGRGDPSRLFHEAAIDFIDEAARGVPRGIIELAGGCLRATAATGQAAVDGPLAREVARRWQEQRWRQSLAAAPAGSGLDQVF